MLQVIAGSAYGYDFMHRVLLLVATWLVAAQQTHIPQTYVLDFVSDQRPAPTAADVAREAHAGVSRQLPSAWEAGAETVPFEVTLLELDRGAYAIGDPVFFQVTLKHVGTKPFAFPWVRDTSTFDGDRPVTQRAVLLLSLKDDVLGSQLIGDENITYGGESIPESFRLLGPGDTVKIRGRARWYLQQGMPAPPPRGWVRDLAIRAQLQMHGVKGMIPILHSANHLRVQLRQRWEDRVFGG
jgi:hypothetical protein